MTLATHNPGTQRQITTDQNPIQSPFAKFVESYHGTGEARRRTSTKEVAIATLGIVCLGLLFKESLETAKNIQLFSSLSQEHHQILSTAVAISAIFGSLYYLCKPGVSILEALVVEKGHPAFEPNSLLNAQEFNVKGQTLLIYRDPYQIAIRILPPSREVPEEIKEECREQLGGWGTNVQKMQSFQPPSQPDFTMSFRFLRPSQFTIHDTVSHHAKRYNISSSRRKDAECIEFHIQLPPKQNLETVAYEFLQKETEDFWSFISSK